MAELTRTENSQAKNIVDEQTSTASTTMQADVGANMEAHGEAIRDKVDGAVRTTEKKADESSGGRVMVGETGDLHDIAARRQP